MENKNINLKSSTIESAIELAKDFLGKLVSPAFTEFGILIADNVKYLRFKNQVRILLKAKEYVENKNIELREIPVKILAPLLDNASLEENEEMQDKWAKMIVNLVDSKKNLQNQIFPYILSQISLQEYEALIELSKSESRIKQKIKDYKNIVSNLKSGYTVEAMQIRLEISKITQGGFKLILKDYELSNLSRLGLIKQLPPKIQIEEIATGDPSEGEIWSYYEAEYDHDNYGYRMTELGEKFIEICEFKEVGIDKKKKA